MGKLSQALSRPKVPIILFVVAAVLIAVSAVGTTRAALTYFSDPYVARLNVSSIGVSLIENDSNVVAWRNYDGNDQWSEGSSELLTDLLPQGQQVQLGRAYPESLAVQNTGTIGEYVRVSIQRYWEDAQGTKVRTVSPELIKLNFLTRNGWIVDPAASTTERTVLYYNSPLAPGDITPPLCDSIAIDPAVASKVTQTTDETVGEDGKTYTTITTSYDYDGMRFCLEATVDAVQDHSAAQAIQSAWGTSVTVTDGMLSLEGGE